MRDALRWVALLFVGVMVLLTFGLVVHVPVDDARNVVEVTAPSDPTVVVDKANRVIRVDIDSISQDYLVCLAAACKLPAEWRQPMVPVFGPAPGTLDVVTDTGLVRRFTVSTIPGTAGVVFMPNGEER